MTTDASPSGGGSALEKQSEMIAMAHGTWNKRQAKNDNKTAVFDISKWKTESIMIKDLKLVYQTIENLGTYIQITQFLGNKNEIADALSRLSRAGDYKLKEKIFQHTYLKMNLNPTIDLFTQHFNNLLLKFMSTIRGHGEIAIDA
ncbi:MAG: hypothetical protein EZS28_048136, partial [Streblomastix strix]